MSDFGRLITAMITPFTADNDVDYDEAIRLAQYLVDHGTDTLLLAGTTGESPTLTHDEENQLFNRIRSHFNGSVKVMAGTGSNSTATAIRSTQKAQELGVDSVLLVVPYYNKPCQEGLYQHFKAISENTDLPILLYNIPGRTSRNMDPETIQRLSKLPNIFGVKEAAGSVDQMAAIRRLTSDDFVIYSGDDGLTLSFMEQGAYGVVSVAAHCAGQQIKDMMTHFVEGRSQEARAIQTRLQPLFDVLFCTSNPTPVKAALEMMGFQVGSPRLPLIPATQKERDKIKDVLTSLSLI